MEVRQIPLKGHVFFIAIYFIYNNFTTDCVPVVIVGDFAMYMFDLLYSNPTYILVDKFALNSVINLPLRDVEIYRVVIH